MSWLNSLTNNVIKNFLSVDNPDKVLEVKAQDYVRYNVHCREDSLFLYPPTTTKKDFELVLHRPCNETLYDAYSLSRCSTQEDAETKFLQYKDKVPVLVSVCKELCTTAQLQKVCETILENPSWSLAHLATHLNLGDCLSDPSVNKYINEEDIKTGISPLQLAIQDGNVKMVHALLSNNASLDHFDHANESVLHYAAKTNKQIVQLLCSKSTNTINSKNGEGYTPLLVACRSDKPECVFALLEAGADVNISSGQRRNTGVQVSRYETIQDQDFHRKLHEEDMKYGGTPLHWACSREVIEALVSKNCDINSLNFDKRTPLHIMVLRNRLECVVALLSLNADCNFGDKDGNTPLHLAVQEGNETIVKALVVFGADLNLMNCEGNTPRHGIAFNTSPGNRILHILHSVGAERCPEDHINCNFGCKASANNNGQPPPSVISPPDRKLLNNLLELATTPQPTNKKKCRVLSLDGGGIRGLVLVAMLIELEKTFEIPILHCFDWIAGTSTGGILALALTVGKSLQECLCLYIKMKNLAFTGKRPYPSDAFEKILKDTFGADTTMATIDHPKIMITATLADRQPVDLHLFRNYSSPSSILEVGHEGPFEEPLQPFDQLIWRVARATGAAPTYFRASGKFLDGGLIANNPTLDALTEIQECNVALRARGMSDEEVSVSLVVSLGTGVIPVTPLTKEVDVFRPESLWDAGKLMFGFQALGQVLIDQATQADGRVIDRARAWCSSLGIPYFRFSPQLSEDIAMDEKDESKLINMLYETKAYMHSKTQEILDLAKILKDISS